MEELDVAVVGGGPAGLRAAEVAAANGRRVTLFDGKPGVGRKFLVAGKGGLNITHTEDFDRFVSRYSGGDHWESLIRDFDPSSLREWCHDLGQETFHAGSGRVYPKTLKGAPLLRAWIGRLGNLGVEIRPRHKWTKLSDGRVLQFENGSEYRAKSIVFAMGGASWPQTGSDGTWLERFEMMGISCTPFRPANCGWECDWSDRMIETTEGLPIKNIVVSANSRSVSGELLITRYGLEGGTIYALGRDLRAMDRPSITVDFKPTFTAEQLIAKLSGSKGNFMLAATKAWKLSVASAAILSGKQYPDVKSLAEGAKSFEIILKRPRPVAEAISSAGGVSWEEVDSNLMLKRFPGIYVCGEMLDWEAPTGGYLLQGAFATGTRAGTFA